MSVQTTVTTQSGGLLGALFDSGPHEELPMELPAASVAKVVTIAATAATNSTLYTLALDGIMAYYTSDGSATTTEIAAGLLAAWNNNALCAAKATGASLTATTFSLTGMTAGDDFVVALEGATTTSTVTTPAQDNSVLGFGYAAFSTAVGVVRTPVSSDTNAKFVGVAAHTHDFDPVTRPTATAPDGYVAGRTVSVARKGRRYVKAYGTVTAGSSGVYAYVSGPLKGQFAGSSDGALTVDLGTLYSGLRWHASSANGRAVLELNLP